MVYFSKKLYLGVEEFHKLHALSFHIFIYGIFKQNSFNPIKIERKNRGQSPITELIHTTLDKVGVKIPETKRRLSRQLLTGMNVAQLQIIVNELHTFIETLNEKLVKYLMERDDLHMKQDSMLVDIEDITRYLLVLLESSCRNFISF
jgi:hypothetical protein